MVSGVKATSSMSGQGGADQQAGPCHFSKIDAEDLRP